MSHFFAFLGVVAVLILLFYLGLESERAEIEEQAAGWSAKVIAIPSRGVWRFEYAGGDGALDARPGLSRAIDSPIPSPLNFEPRHGALAVRRPLCVFRRLG